MKNLLIATLILLVSAGSATASTLNFNDLTTGSSLGSYAGFTWSDNLLALDGNITNSDGALATISSATPFDFTSANIGSRYLDGLTITITGFRQGGAQVNETPFTVGTGSPSLYTFTDLTNLTSLRFTPSWNPVNPSTNFVIDNLSYTESAPGTVPEPSTFLLFAAGLGCAAVFCSRFR